MSNCRATCAFLFAAALLLGSAHAALGAGASHGKFDHEAGRRAASGSSARTARVIVRLNPGAQLPAQYARYVRADALNIVNSVVLDVPESALNGIAASSGVARVSTDRVVRAHNLRTSITSGAFFAQHLLGYTGAGIGIAVLDSGITTYHDDFTAKRGSSKHYPYGDQRVAYFKDFVNGQTLPYDDNGHGTHVAGTIAGNGADSNGENAGMAPDASIVALKVLDAHGQGTVSTVIAALNWVAANARAYNIRVVNLSVGASVLESVYSDPLTLATRALVDQGIVVVAATGNFGKDAAGLELWGGVTAPGNAPWVLTVGASNTKGTFTRGDDEHASFSSRGPTAIDFRAKPDLLASGVGTVSTAAPGSTYYAQYPQYRAGGQPGGVSPYFVLSGTSQAAPVVTGTVAEMLQANPRLTPNLVKAILQYTAESSPVYSPLEQGAGFLNALGAVGLAEFYAQNHHAGDLAPIQSIWSRHIIWGNMLLSKGFMLPDANAWKLGVEWGAVKANDGSSILWGTSCISCGDSILWGTNDRNNIVWGTGDRGNIVWGTEQNIVWGTEDRGNIVWGTDDRSNIVWGTACGGADCDDIAWGTDTRGNIVWGTGDRGNIVWGTDANIVWGTDEKSNIVWGTDSNIVWGTDALVENNIVWGTDNLLESNIVWGTDGLDLDRSNIVWGTVDGSGIGWAVSDGHSIVRGRAEGDSVVWGTPASVGTLWQQAGLGSIPTAVWYRIFLSKNFDTRWIRREFGDRASTRDRGGKHQ